MNVDKVGFGIVGCGGIGPLHADALAQVDDARLVAVCDVIPERAQKVAEKHGGRWYDDYRKLLDDREVMVVNVCTPSGMHGDMGVQAAQAGKHVLTEKPMDLRTDKVDALIAACAKAGVKLGCIFQNRFNPAARKIKSAIEQGRFGDLVLGVADCIWYRAQSYYDSGEWRGTWDLDRGCLSNQGVHFVDQLCWFMGDVEQVLCADCPTLKRDIESEDLGIALLRFANGARGVIQATTLAYPGVSSRVVVCGTTGSAAIDGANLLMFKVEGEEQAEAADGPTREGPTTASDPLANLPTGHAAQMIDMIEAIRDNRDPTISGPEARRAIHALELIYRAAGRPA
jgi:UDP-N-acetyl-2-amino-2-deoxyglucuronate dehydrogenase